jgi:K(+)-stimulated pyrophosphate-energized sodium pump
MTDSFLTTNSISLSIALALIGLAIAIILIRKILASDAGNERMAQIAGAVQEGAKAYLSRQTRAVTIIAFIMVFAVWYARTGASAIGFVIGSVCSLAAGYIGMTIAVTQIAAARAANDPGVLAALPPQTLIGGVSVRAPPSANSGRQARQTTVSMAPCTVGP